MKRYGMVVVATGVIACCHGGTVVCPPNEVRNQMDCDLGFSVDSTNIQGSVSVFNIGANASTTTTALREVSETLKTFAFKKKELCGRWNACVIEKDAYNNQANGYADAIQQFVDKKDAIGGDPATATQAVNGLVRFSLEFATDIALAQDPKAVPAKPCPPDIQDSEKFSYAPATVLAAGDPAPTGAHVSFRVKTTMPIYLYLFQRLASNNLVPDVIFPDARIAVTNPIPANTVLSIPVPPDAYCLNEKDVGVEKVFIVASRKPLANMDAAVAQINAGGVKTIDAAGDALQSVNDIPADPTTPPPACLSDAKSRGLVFQSGGAPQAKTGCTRSRGLVLDTAASNAKAPASFVAVSEPGDDGMVVKVFPYNHVTWEDYQRLVATPATTMVTGVRKRDIMIEQ